LPKEYSAAPGIDSSNLRGVYPAPNAKRLLPGARGEAFLH
jgi:hypothetical protein